MGLFSQPIILALLPIALLALGGALYLAAARRREIVGRMADAEAFEKLISPDTALLRKWKTGFYMAAVAFSLLAWAGPQWGIRLVSSETTTSHVAIAIDTSLSMLSQDLKPNRIENAKLMLGMLAERLSGDRIGVVAFSGQAFIQCPMTTDIDAIKYFISTVQAGMLPVPGTSISDAIRLSSSMLARYPGRKALILLTDGEDRGADPREQAKLAAEQGISIFAVGIGSPEGDLIPIKEEPANKTTMTQKSIDNGPTEYKKDKDGKTVVTRLDEKTLLDLASLTGGAYVRYSQADTSAQSVAGQLKELEKTKWQGRARARYENRFQIPLFMAFLLLLIELLTAERRTGFKSLWMKYLSEITEKGKENQAGK